eukprot:gnl/MRDRNA2_/MRDRNA2_94160_c0_seq1.p1 gnl/MRDRNA2_/MRDRNA2_94160_c0~~gnl/MRDRNA2_/MRDRNA2_94160_c0_seq1.p1  ORF type:complete len:378 (+),score=90.98 gnl/MRDRNA2_/MRDRNA2_94160_c0_seq1:74-1207(+)
MRKSTAKRASSPGDAKAVKREARGTKGGASKGGGKGKGKEKPVVQLDFDLAPARSEDPQRTAKEIEILEKVNDQSSANAAQQVVDILSPAASGWEMEVVRACCLALLRLMQNQNGLFAVIKAAAMECLHAIKETIVPEEGEPSVFQQEVQVVQEEAARKAAAYIETVDHIDFHELPNVMLLVGRLHRESELVCRKGFATLMRFASYDVAHRKDILHGGLVTVIAYVLKNFLEPELLQQSLLFLCRLSAAPFGKDASALILADESLLPAVITTLEDHPADMGMQLHGFRLLTVWSRASVDLRQEVLSSAAPSLLQASHKSISDAGLDHMGSWLWAIAGRSLVDDVSADYSYLQAQEKEDAPARKSSKGRKADRKSTMK